MSLRIFESAVLARVAFAEASRSEHAAERALIDAARTDARRLELQAGRGAARRAFEAAGLLSAPAVTADDSGRPVVAVPGWHVSIAHDGGVAFAAVSRAPLGIDAVALDRTPDVMRVVQSRIDTGRAKALGCAAPAGFEASMLLWSGWEALGKRTGGGVLSGPMWLEVAPAPVDDGAVARVGEVRLRWFVDGAHLVCLATTESS